MDVGVRELKQRLSHYLRLVAEGERITVTDRGRPAAVLVPVPGGDELERGLAQGWISPPRVSGPPPPTPRRVRASMSVLEMLDEDRGPG